MVSSHGICPLDNMLVCVGVMAATGEWHHMGLLKEDMVDVISRINRRLVFSLSLRFFCIVWRCNVSTHRSKRRSCVRSKAVGKVSLGRSCTKRSQKISCKRCPGKALLQAPHSNARGFLIVLEGSPAGLCQAQQLNMISGFEASLKSGARADQHQL